MGLWLLNEDGLPRRTQTRNLEAGACLALAALHGSVSEAPSGRNVGSPGQVPPSAGRRPGYTGQKASQAL